jgi:hypothetical protein
MNKTFSLVVLMLMVVAMLGVVSADTVIAGKIYNADFTAIEPGASVTVTCGGILAPEGTVLSKDDGAYSVTYDEELGCHQGSTLSVHAIKTGVGENTVTGEIHDGVVESLDLNLGVVNVPLVPEFGLIAGLTTVLGALGVFFFVRKK